MAQARDFQNDLFDRWRKQSKGPDTQEILENYTLSKTQQADVLLSRYKEVIVHGHDEPVDVVN